MTATKKVNKKVAQIDNPNSGNRGFILAILGVFIIGIAGVAILASSRESDISDAPQTAPVEVDGEILAPMPQGVSVSSGANDPVVGTVAPTLTGTSFDDTPVVIGPDGRNKVVYFLAHWCPHCQVEVPLVQGLINDGLLPEGVDVYAVATSTSPAQANFPPETWLNVEGWTGVTMRDDDLSSSLAAYGGAAFPYVVYLDGENRVITRSSGGLQADQTLALWAQTAAGVPQ